MAAEIVQDDDVAGLQDWRELLFNIGAEAFAVDRPIEDAGRGEPVEAQCAHKGQRSPVAVWGEAAHTLALGSPAAQRRHVGFDPGLVDEDQTAWIEARLKRSPTLAPAGNVGARLLKREQSFF
jgi:hypothetical protein